MKVVSQGHCGFLPSPAAKIKGTYQKLFPHGLPGSNKEASIEEENYTLLDLARIECCHIILSNLGWLRFIAPLTFRLEVLSHSGTFSCPFNLREHGGPGKSRAPRGVTEQAQKESGLHLYQMCLILWNPFLTVPQTCYRLTLKIDGKSQWQWFGGLFGLVTALSTQQEAPEGGTSRPEAAAQGPTDHCDIIGPLTQPHTIEYWPNPYSTTAAPRPGELPFVL